MLYYDISYWNQKYKGVMNELNFKSYPYKKDQKYKKFLETESVYFNKVFDCDLTKENSFKIFIKYYHIFREEFNIPCEIIAFDTTPIANVFGYSVELLGIDIVNVSNDTILDSLLEDEDCLHTNIRYLLNENGLCRTVDDIEKILPWQNLGDLKWEPCYVYRVLI